MVLKKSVARYYCEICYADFGLPSSARKCEKRPTEKLPKWIKVGKEVVGDFYCGYCRTGFTIGKIVEIVGPTLPNIDLEVHFIGRPERREMHVHYLHIVAPCGSCKRKHRFVKAASSVQENKRF